MPSTETIRRISIQARADGVDATAAALGRLAVAQDNVADASMASSRGALSADRELQRLALRYDENTRATAALERATRTLAAARQQGLVTSQREAELLDLVRTKHRAAGMAAEGGVGPSVYEDTEQRPEGFLFV